MLIAKVLSWQDILSEKGAYDAMFWMGGLMSLATALGKSGFITWVAKDTTEIIGSAGLGWIASFLIVILFLHLLPLLLRLSDSAYLCHVCRFRRRSGSMRDAGL